MRHKNSDQFVVLEFNFFVRVVYDLAIFGFCYFIFFRFIFRNNINNNGIEFQRIFITYDMASQSPFFRHIRTREIGCNYRLRTVIACKWPYRKKFITASRSVAYVMDQYNTHVSTIRQ